MDGMLNKNGEVVSMQPSKMGNIPEGHFKLKTGSYFNVKNITDDIVNVKVKLANNDDYIETVLYPGWNVEIIKEIQNAPANKLQYGF